VILIRVEFHAIAARQEKFRLGKIDEQEYLSEVKAIA
jgi:hypothetical protein